MRIISQDIYQAVMQEGVTTTKEFAAWLLKNRGIDAAAETPDYTRLQKEGH
jgi:hypothetical protein